MLEYRCTFSKSAEPVLYEIAGLLGNKSASYDDSEGGVYSYLSVVQLDASRNEVDHPRVKILGYPSVQLFLRGNRYRLLHFPAILDFCAKYNVGCSRLITRGIIRRKSY